jgi:hypothetical protein
MIGHGSKRVTNHVSWFWPQGPISGGNAMGQNVTIEVRKQKILQFYLQKK